MGRKSLGFPNDTTITIRGNEYMFLISELYIHQHNQNLKFISELNEWKITKNEDGERRQHFTELYGCFTKAAI